METLHLRDTSAKDRAEWFAREIARRHGWQLPVPGIDPVREMADLAARFGSRNAGLIVRDAIEKHGGYWHGAPITIRRFAASHDEFFGRPILRQSLAEMGLFGEIGCLT